MPRDVGTDSGRENGRGDLELCICVMKFAGAVDEGVQTDRTFLQALVWSRTQCPLPRWRYQECPAPELRQLLRGVS